MQIEKFEDIIAWQKSRELVSKIYTLSKNTGFTRDYGLASQIQRASVSIMSNIAEGFERKSNKELSHFLFIAKGSCGETRSQLYILKDLQYISPQEFDEMYNTCTEISKMLSAFIKKL